MSYLDWHVGMKVVCIADASEWVNQTINLPQRGMVYTIRTIERDNLEVFIRLTEIINAPIFMGAEPDFCCTAFRPVQTRKVDISIFTAMLHDQREKVPS